MLVSDVIQTISFEQVEKLLSALRPTNELWQPYPGEWIFRGQFCAELSLLPSAFRTDSWMRFGQPGKAPHNPPGSAVFAQEDHEYNLLLRYFLALDRAGIDIPNEIFVRKYFNTMEKRRVGGGRHDHHQFITDPAISTFAALAQHHSVPTRLLDWSRFGLYAAYFAASEAAVRHRSNPEPRRQLAVWAIPVAFVDFARAARERSGRQLPKLEVLHAPRASNPNLHAQSGLFTAWFADNTAPTMELIVEELLDIMRAHPETAWRAGPPLKRLTLPWSEAPKVLRFLSNEQVDAARLFPGRDGVVRFLAEQGMWDAEP